MQVPSPSVQWLWRCRARSTVASIRLRNIAVLVSIDPLAFGMIEAGLVEDMRDVAQPRERRNCFLSIRQIDSNSRDIIAIFGHMAG